MPSGRLSNDVLGEFDLDPTSNDIAQSLVRARKHYTAEDDGLKQQWLYEATIWRWQHSHPEFCNALKNGGRR